MTTRQKLTLLPAPIGIAVMLCWLFGAVTRDEIWFRVAEVLFLPLGLVTLFAAFLLRRTESDHK